MNPFAQIRRPVRVACLAVTGATVVAACGSSTSSSTSGASSTTGSATTSATAASATAASGPVHSGNVTVSLTNYAFHPATIVVKPGTKITFTNHDQTAHTATSIRPAFDTGSIEPGTSTTVSLNKPGTYPYMCQFHAFMRGTLIVRH